MTFVGLSEELTQGLEAVLLATDEAGLRRYPDAVVRDALPLVVLGLGPALAPDALPPTLRRWVLDYLARAGATEARDDADAAARLADYACAHPLPASLVAELDQLLRDGLGSLGAEARDAAHQEWARLTGRGGRTLPGAPVSGTPARPWARMDMRDWNKD